MELIPVSGPSITQKEIDYVTDAVTNAWYGNANIYHDKFERSFANYLGVKYAIALPSCTSAIHLSLLALGITTGDEVIVPDVNWIASAAPINYVGVFCIKPRKGGLWKMRFSTRPLKPLPVNKRLSQKLHFWRRTDIMSLSISQNAILRSSEE